MAQQRNPPWEPANHQALDLELPRDDFVDFLNLDSLDTSSIYPLFEDNAGTSQELGRFDFTGPTGPDVHGEHSTTFHPDYYHNYTNNAIQMQSRPGFDTHIHPGGIRDFQAPGHGAPPTPNSAPMYGKPAKDYQQASHNQDRRQPGPATSGGRITTTFSPFISPEINACSSAVSHTPDYAIPGVYNLSPLTSPAMQPEDPHNVSKTIFGNTVSASPNSHEWENEDEVPGEREDARPRKTRRKASARTQNLATATKSQKGTMSTSRRKSSLTKHLNPAQPNKIRPSLRRDDGAGNAPSTGSTSNSISPRPLDEVLMGPPPRPISTSASSTPYIAPENANSRTPGSPATPASMMGFKPQGSNPSPSSDRLPSDRVHDLGPTPGGLEFLALPEAATQAGESVSGVHAHLDSSAVKPVVKTPGPRPGGRTCPRDGTDGAAVAQKPDSKNQISKKRNSAGSNLVSPALRPKVSPNVKPLLPDGAGMDSETHALLLASRSNYENLLSGAHLPGVSYPADLGANLSSKRTSHKLAEQGRRNRINFALQEMQALLPPKFTATLPASKDLDKAESNGNDGSNAGRAGHATTQSGNSKAATVECAIEYIKHLQRQCLAKDQTIERLKEADGVREP